MHSQIEEMRKFEKNSDFYSFGHLRATFGNGNALGRPHKEAAVHPLPFQLNVNRYLRMYEGPTAYLALRLQPGLYEVGTDENDKYIIGVVLSGILYPFMSHCVERNYNYERVKLLINGGIRNTKVPISNEDPINDLFFKEFGPANIRSAEIPQP